MEHSPLPPSETPSDAPDSVTSIDQWKREKRRVAREIFIALYFRQAGESAHETLKRVREHGLDNFDYGGAGSDNPPFDPDYDNHPPDSPGAA